MKPMSQPEIAQLDAEHRKFIREIAAANGDLRERMNSLEIRLAYYPDDDLFEVGLGDVQEALTESIENLFYLRVAPDTLKIVGIEVPQLSKRLADNEDLAQLWEAITGSAAPPGAATDRFVDTLRSLVSA
jgi:hypothetical protein